MKHLLLLSSLLLCLWATDTAAQQVWKTYHHRNGYTVSLPDTFRESILVAAGTLQYYDIKTGRDISVSVESLGYGSPAELQQSYNNDLQNRKGISYKVLKADWYVISGEDEEGIFYNKSIIRNGIQHHLRISYPPAQKALFDAILGKVSASFQPDKKISR